MLKLSENNRFGLPRSIDSLKTKMERILIFFHKELKKEKEE
jgi:hypothetical protein